MENPDRRRPPASGESVEGFPVLRANVAGMDVGSEQHWVCAPARTGGGREVAVFAATTSGVEQLAAWLKARGVASVALESTGVYWIAPHEILEHHGFELLIPDNWRPCGIHAVGRARPRLRTSCAATGGRTICSA